MGSRHCNYFPDRKTRCWNGFWQVYRETKGLQVEKFWQCKGCNIFGNRHGGSYKTFDEINMTEYLYEEEENFVLNKKILYLALTMYMDT